MKLFISTLFLFLIAGLFFTTSKAGKDRWEYLGSTEKEYYYYDEDSIVNSSQGVVKVWGKKHGRGHKSLDNFLSTYVVWLAEVKCNERQMRFLESIEFYAGKSKLIPTSGGWVNINPDSIGEVMLEKFCNDHK
jgi:hypothetical protein